MNVIRETPASHRFADVEGGSSTGHGVDDQGARFGKVMERVGDDSGWNRAGMRDTEGSVVFERPDVIRGGTKARGETVASPQVFVSGMNRFRA